MPSRQTRRRKAAKKLAKNVASVLRQRIENMKAREANNAEAFFREDGYYNAPENNVPENHYNENVEIIASIQPMMNIPVRSKSKSKKSKKSRKSFRKTLRRANAANKLNKLNRRNTDITNY